MSESNRRHRILELDPELASALEDAAIATAAKELTAPIASIPAGLWQPDFHGDLPGALGMLVLDGLMARTVTLAGHPSTELLLAGDLIRPWQQDDAAALVTADAGWQVLEPARVALLDRRFVQAAAAWPELLVDLAARLLRRSRRQAVTAAIVRIGRVDMRVLVLLWHLAERIGRVTPEGVVVPVALTHETLASLVGARRPSVTTALSGLSRKGIVLRRRESRHWLLTDASRQELERLCTGKAPGALSEGGARVSPAGPARA